MVEKEASVPKQRDLYKPIMQVLSDGTEKCVDNIVDEVIAKMNLKPEITEIESNYKGKSLLKYNIEWSLTNLSNAGFVESPAKSIRRITAEGLNALKENFDWTSFSSTKFAGTNPIQKIQTEDCNNSDSTSFFDYIHNQNLIYDTNLIEDFLLSLKANQFLILSGCSGTGKTKLAQEYGKFISHNKTDDTAEITFSVTLGKSDENGGYTLSSDTFFDAFPEYKKPNGLYKFNIGGTDGFCKIQMTPRLWYRGNECDEKIIETIKHLKEHQKKADLKLFVNKNDDSGSNYVIIPVGSNWTDGRSIIGYKNILTGKYCHTQALDLMIDANINSNVPKLLILDEMNLSHVEWYFSDLLSCMESKEPIKIDSDGIVPESINAEDNLFVIGTVNMDETTYAFSPKVLDRANVIEFQSASISELLDGIEKYERPTGNVRFLQDCMAGISVRTKGAPELITEMSSVKDNLEIIKTMIEEIDALHKMMSSIRLPFGFRTVDEIMRFMYVAWKYEGEGKFSNWKRYLDSQIMQKILPKIHGNTSIGKCLGDMKQFCIENEYQKSSNKLDRMLKTLENQRYVSFNS